MITPDNHHYDMDRIDKEFKQALAQLAETMKQSVQMRPLMLKTLHESRSFNKQALEYMLHARDIDRPRLQPDHNEDA
jgi:hypothetical protein